LVATDLSQTTTRLTSLGLTDAADLEQRGLAPTSAVASVFESQIQWKVTMNWILLRSVQLGINVVNGPLPKTISCRMMAWYPMILYARGVVLERNGRRIVSDTKSVLTVNVSGKLWSKNLGLSTLWYVLMSWNCVRYLIAAQPKDSEHPDREANVEVYVEAWVSEEEYQQAKERNELAWQSASTAVDDMVVTDVPVSFPVASVTL
jgi:hypothetical protein